MSDGRADPGSREKLLDRIAELERENRFLKDGIAAERTAGRAALEASEGRFHAILESATDYAIITKDRRGRVTGWNAGARRVLGWEEAEVLGEPIGFIFTPEDRAARAPEQEMAKALTEGRADDERWHMRKDGSRFWATGVLMPLRSDSEEGFVKILRDHTARKRAEDELHRQLALNQAITEHAAEALFLIGTDGRITFANPAAEAMFGWSRDEMVGRELHALLHHRHPDGSPYAADACPLVDALGSGKVLKDHADVFFRKDGLAIDVICSNAPIRGMDGRVAGAVLVAHDVTQRRYAEKALRESEANFRTLANAIPQLAWIATRAGEIVWCNQRWFDYTGLSMEDMQGDRWRGSRIFHPDHADRVIAHFERCLAAGEPWEDTFPLRARDGGYRWFLSRAAPMRDADGRLLRWFGTNTDITEQREAEAHQRLLMGELTHRVKNTLAIVQAIATQTIRNAASLPEARDAFNARLAALAQAHDVLLQESWGSAGIRTIVAGALRLHDDGTPGRFRVEGPDLALGPKPALALAMILHELSTNAAKYGALSTKSGHVDLGWSVTRPAGGEPCLVLRWSERGGPPVTAPPERTGFGSRLIKRGLAGTGEGRVRMTYAPDGLTCTIEAPLAAVQAFLEP